MYKQIIFQVINKNRKILFIPVSVLKIRRKKSLILQRAVKKVLSGMKICRIRIAELVIIFSWMTLNLYKYNQKADKKGVYFRKDWVLIIFMTSNNYVKAKK